MAAQQEKDIIDCYDKTARDYAGQFMNELAHKHLDRLLLRSFAAENREAGPLIDLGCGPGQTTRFLHDCGISNLLGTDIAPQMIAVAQSLNPELQFAVADMLKLPHAGDSFGSAIAFYSIVHFDETQVRSAFQEINRILKPGGQFLFSFHCGNGSVHLDTFLGHDVHIDFNFFELATILTLVEETGFEVIDALERQPYKDAEHPSKRAYIWVRKMNARSTDHT